MNYMLQVKAENKEVPKVIPDKLTAEINEEYSGVIEFSGTTITVSDRDSVSVSTIIMASFSYSLDANS
jgi:hypothetical protein